jgi:hypothetical protein
MTMVEITLKRSDSIETVLPTIEMAMESGELCRISNIDYLGRLEESALALLTRAESLLDSNTGKIFRSRPGFGLIGIDECGVARVLVQA